MKSKYITFLHQRKQINNQDKGQVSCTRQKISETFFTNTNIQNFYPKSHNQVYSKHLHTKDFYLAADVSHSNLPSFDMLHKNSAKRPKFSSLFAFRAARLNDFQSKSNDKFLT